MNTILNDCTRWERIRFYLTCWIPINRYQYFMMQENLIKILEGFKSSDQQHFNTEGIIIREMKKIAELTLGKQEQKKKEDDKNEQMYG